MAEPSDTKRNLNLSRTSLPEALAESLRERILLGEFQEGDQLIQESLAQQYDVSRMPVREALRQLEAMGLVSLRLHRGAVVTTIPTEQISELFDLRAMLESEILTHAIPKLTDATLAESMRLLRQLETAYHQSESNLWGELNGAFHRSLYLPSARIQTMALINTINLQTDRYGRIHLLLNGSTAVQEDEHRELIRLCVARDVKRASKFLEHHIRSAGVELLEFVVRRRMEAAESPTDVGKGAGGHSRARVVPS